MPRRNSRHGAPRRHTNNHGATQAKRGKLKDRARRLAAELGVPYARKQAPKGGALDEEASGE